MIPAINTESPTVLPEMVEHLHDHPDFVAFAHALVKNYKDKPEEWQNRDLASFLEALAAWTEDMDGYYEGKGDALPAQPSWKVLGEILLAAKVYE